MKIMNKQNNEKEPFFLQNVIYKESENRAKCVSSE